MLAEFVGACAAVFEVEAELEEAVDAAVFNDPVCGATCDALSDRVCCDSPSGANATEQHKSLDSLVAVHSIGVVSIAIRKRFAAGVSRCAAAFGLEFEIRTRLTDAESDDAVIMRRTDAYASTLQLLLLDSTAKQEAMQVKADWCNQASCQWLRSRVQHKVEQRTNRSRGKT